MTASTKKATPGTKTEKTKEGTTRKRTQTEKGKYNARNQRQNPSKRIAKSSEPEESSEEETRQPHKKCPKVTEHTDSEEVGHNGSNIEDVVEVASNNGGSVSESDVQVSN
jgi:hypothetical protein